MKILQVMAGAEHGGAETAFVDMCIAMHEAGEEIEIVTRSNDIRVPRLEKAGLVVHTAPFGGAVDVYTPWRIGKIIADFEPLIVQTWMARAAKKTPGWARTKTRQRYLVASRLGGYYKIKNFKSSDYFTTITPDLKDYLVKGGIEAERIRFLPNFAETELDVSPVARKDMDTPKDATVLLTLARLHENKALDILLRTLPDLPDVYLWMAGRGRRGPRWKSWRMIWACASVCGFWGGARIARLFCRRRIFVFLPPARSLSARSLRKAGRKRRL